jgi:precorrin-4 methylase
MDTRRTQLYLEIEHLRQKEQELLANAYEISKPITIIQARTWRKTATRKT